MASSQMQPSGYTYYQSAYESFMRKHLQHYGYYSDKTRNSDRSTQWEDWDKTDDPKKETKQGSSDSADDDDEDKEKVASSVSQNVARSSQVLFDYKFGKIIPKVRETLSLFQLINGEINTQLRPKWPCELQVIPEVIEHIYYVPKEPEPFYVRTGNEAMPPVKSDVSGRTVFQYEPLTCGYFLRSRIGGSRAGCQKAAVELQDSDDTTLVFESRFESGNLMRAVQISDTEYELYLRYDLYTERHTQWFYFRVQNTRPNVRYRFTIVNLMKPDSLYNHGMRPLFYSEKDAKEKKIGWKRIGDSIKYYKNNLRETDENDKPRTFYSLTFMFEFSHSQDTCYFAHCYPYTYSDLQKYLCNILNDPMKSKFCKNKVLCRSLAGNLVHQLTITSPTSDEKEDAAKKGIVITSRVHPGETNSSWMMKGFIDYLTGPTADAKLLRDAFVIKIVPMLNPDGVIVGNYRCSLAGRDLNRNYKSILKDCYPDVYYAKMMIKRFTDERDVVLYCDLHGHSRKNNVFIYGCENRNNPHRRLRERIFPVMLSRNAKDKFSFDSSKFKIQKSREGTGRIVMWTMGILCSYTMEATFSGSTLGKMKGFHFSCADFESLGYHFCDTLLDYCDPDPSKAANILLELETKLKEDVMKRLIERGKDPTHITDSDLDISEEDERGSDAGSSDAGSDSSEDEGLPVQLVQLAKQFADKVKLKQSKKAAAKAAADAKAKEQTDEKTDRNEDSAHCGSSRRDMVRQRKGSSPGVVPRVHQAIISYQARHNKPKATTDRENMETRMTDAPDPPPKTHSAQAKKKYIEDMSKVFAEKGLNYPAETCQPVAQHPPICRQVSFELTLPEPILLSEEVHIPRSMSNQSFYRTSGTTFRQLLQTKPRQDITETPLQITEEDEEAWPTATQHRRKRHERIQLRDSRLSSHPSLLNAAFSSVIVPPRDNLVRFVPHKPQNRNLVQQTSQNFYVLTSETAQQLPVEEPLSLSPGDADPADRYSAGRRASAKTTGNDDGRDDKTYQPPTKVSLGISYTTPGPTTATKSLFQRPVRPPLMRNSKKK